MQLVLPKGKVKTIPCARIPSGILYCAQQWSFLKSNCLGMKIKINDEWQDVAVNATLQSIVYARLGDNRKGTAVAVNGKVISQAEQSAFLLQEGDTMLIIKATQGG